MTNEKSLLEDVLNVKDKKIKNRLLDNDDTISKSENEKFRKKENISQLKLDNTEKSNKKIIKKKVKNRKNKNMKINTNKTKLQEKLEARNGENNEKLKRKKIIRNFFKKRKMKQISLNPYVRSEVNVRSVMKDVIVSLFPAIIAAILVYGIKAVLVIATSVFSAVATEKFFSGIFLNNKNSTHNLSAVITGILMALTLAPLTSLPVVAFGASMAIIFGKLMYGGIGKNIFNPAVIGREFMTVFFPVTMSSGAVWFNKEALKVSNISFFGNFSKTPFTNYLDSLLLNPSGALGSYSAFALILGGLYLLLKNRISWHIPVSLFATAFLATMFLKDGISVSIGGMLLIGIFMATDMPTSPTSPAGKVYYGIMLGIVIVLLSMLGIKNETLSYVLIILNPFAKIINKVFRPVVFGYDLKEVIGEQLRKSALVTLGILVVAISFVALHKIGAIPYLVYLYILVLTVNLTRNKKI